MIIQDKHIGSEEQFRAFANALPGLVWVTDASGKQLFASKRWQEYTGIDPYNEASFKKVVHPEDIDRVMDMWNACLQNGEPYNLQLRLRDKEGEYQWFQGNSETVRNAKGEIEIWAGAFININEQKKAGLKREHLFKIVRESEEKFRDTVKQAPVGIVILRGPEFVIEMMNETYLQIVGRPESEMIGRLLFDSLPEVKDAVAPLLTGVFNTGIAYHGNEFPVMLNRYGKAELSYFNFVYQALCEPDNRISGIIVVAMEVTRSVKAKHLLAESEKQFRNFIMQSPIPMAIFRGAEYIIEMANTVMFEKIWRKKPEEILGTRVLEAFPELIEQKYPELLKKVFTTGKPHREIESVAYIQGDDGLKKFYLDFEYAPLFDTDGVVSGIMITVNNETEKVEARIKVEEAEERLRLAMEAADVATWDLDLASGNVICSSGLPEIFGYAPAMQFVHKQLREKIHPADRQTVVEKAFATALETGIYQYEARILKGGNEIRWIRTQGKIIYDDSRKPVKLLGTVRDITEEKLHEQELMESEQKFRLLADAMPQIVWTSDALGNMNYYNKAVYDYTGMSFEMISDNKWMEMIHPDERLQNIQAWMRAVATGDVYIFENRFRRYDGVYRWHLSRAIPQRNSAGQIQMWVGTSTDIHDIKEQDRMKDYFISMASHELKTPLTSLKGFTQILKEKYGDSGDVFLVNALSRMDKQTVKLTKLITDLLDLSRIKSGSLPFSEERFCINELIEQVADEIRIIHPTHKVRFTNPGNMYVFADRERIAQVLDNILTNAVKYSPGSDTVLVSSRVEGKNVVVAVEDYGVGILKRDQEKVFERFYRVEGKSQKTFPGLGIGLYIAAEIIRRSNGSISVKSEPGKGSLFYFSLPVL
ncbi:MAG: PAS domain S-box protein [Chitinophagaceae bacterium]|nr:PAS domain S-box protein [Chitinophagaceae bacterium]